MKVWRMRRHVSTRQQLTQRMIEIHIYEFPNDQVKTKTEKIKRFNFYAWEPSANTIYQPQLLQCSPQYLKKNPNCLAPASNHLFLFTNGLYFLSGALCMFLYHLLFRVSIYLNCLVNPISPSPSHLLRGSSPEDSIQLREYSSDWLMNINYSAVLLPRDFTKPSKTQRSDVVFRFVLTASFS